MENSLIDIKEHVKKYANVITNLINVCLLYTSDAADE